MSFPLRNMSGYSTLYFEHFREDLSSLSKYKRATGTLHKKLSHNPFNFSINAPCYIWTMSPLLQVNPTTVHNPSSLNPNQTVGKTCLWVGRCNERAVGNWKRFYGVRVNSRWQSSSRAFSSNQRGSHYLKRRWQISYKLAAQAKPPESVAQLITTQLFRRLQFPLVNIFTRNNLRTDH